MPRRLTPTGPLTRAAAAALLLAIPGCQPGPGAANGAADGADVPESERAGGTVVWAGAVNLLNLNPLTSFETNDLLVDMFVMFTPLLRDSVRGMEPRPWLAERWDTVRTGPDTVALTFHLRRDVKWHDGRPTTAEDVRFTFDRMLDPRTGFADRQEVSRYRPVAEVLDSFTVRFHLRPNDDLLEPWAWRAIAPAHILGDLPPEQLRTRPFTRAGAVGNGPFRLASGGNGRWVFEANEDFPEALGGRPYLDRLVYQTMPEEQTRVTALLAGTVDVTRVYSPSAAASLRDRGFRVLTSPTPEWSHIVWNTRRPLFRDPRVRRALSMAIDRRQIVDGVFAGFAQVGRSTVTPTHWSYDPDDPEVNLPYDPEGARALLAEAGWEDRDGDGVVEDPAGTPLRFSLLRTLGGRTQEQVATFVQSQLRAVGADVQILILEQGTKNARLLGTVQPDGRRVRNFDAALWSFYDNPAKDDTGKLHSRSRNEGMAISGYQNPEADRLMDSLRYLTDRAAAAPLWKRYQRLIVRDAPVTVLYYADVMLALSPRMRGVRIDPVGELVSVRNWWVDGPRRGR
jgi:peptide/nickel transport system substrate-binding protein